MKLRRFNPSRLYIGLVSFIQRHALAIVIILLTFLISALAAKGLAFLRHYSIQPSDLLNFFGQPKEKLDSTDNTTNFLLLGIRGEGSDSPNLSDTIIIFSYNHQKNEASIISIPRDLWVTSLKAKINTAYHYGEEASPGSGIRMSQAAILEITGLPIHYTSVVDFALFKDVIDLLGGVEVYNPVAFVDDEFPIPGKENAMPLSSRFETISFAAGKIHMDGETALKYVRSRHAVGESGTDYDRGNRQQLLLSALKDKMLVPEFLLDQKKVNSLISLVNSRLVSNIHPSLFPTLAKLALDMKDKTIKNISLSDRPDENGITILYNPPSYQYKGEWVLIPKQNNWNALKQYIRNRLDGTQ